MTRQRAKKLALGIALSNIADSKKDFVAESIQSESKSRRKECKKIATAIDDLMVEFRRRGAIEHGGMRLFPHVHASVWKAVTDLGMSRKF